MTVIEFPKICPSCKQKDVTTFSKCKFCGTKYDAVITQPDGPNVGRNVMITVCGALCLLGLSQMVTHGIKDAQLKRFASVSSEIKTAKKPRVLEFYADWCGPCRMYGPIVEESKAKFGSQVDFKRYNVDEDESRKLAYQLGVQGIPRTCILDRHGNIVEDHVGTMSQESLDGFVRKAISD